jgi:chitin-binding protein
MLRLTWHYRARSETQGYIAAGVFDSHPEPHKSRRWKFFITRPGWDPEKPLSREQFDLTPLEGGEDYDGQPFSGHGLLPPDPHQLQVELPAMHSGYHVLLAIWEVAETGYAIYQVIDLDFLDTASGWRP